MRLIYLCYCSVGSCFLVFDFTLGLFSVCLWCLFGGFCWLAVFCVLMLLVGVGICSLLFVVSCLLDLFILVFGCLRCCLGVLCDFGFGWVFWFLCGVFMSSTRVVFGACVFVCFCFALFCLWVTVNCV